MTTAVQDDPTTTTTPPSPETQLARAPAAAIGFGLSASNWDEGFRIAKVLANSSLVPKDYRGRPEDVVVAMQYGAEIGLPPMAALQSIAVINGKPGVYGDGFLAVIMAAPAYLKHVEYYVLSTGEQARSLRQADLSDDETRAVSMFWRRGIAEPFVGEFSIGDAKRAKLWGKEGPWTNYPGRQLRWRARGFAGRDGFAGELRGVKSAEELHDTPDDIITEAISYQPPPEPIRLSARAASQEAPPELTNELPSDDAPATAPAPTRTPTGTRRGAAPAERARPAVGNGPPVVTESLTILETQFVQPKDAEEFYEVRATVKAEGRAPVGYVFVTKDKALYEVAASCEGNDQLFNITWHGGKRPDGSACKVIDAITAVN
jgi:hypothetical protein